MKAFFFILLAVFLYALQNVIIEQKLKQVQPLLALIHYFPIMLALTVFSLGIQFRGATIEWPSWTTIGFLALCAAIVFIADICFFNAYFNGGSLPMITTMTACLPVIATLIQFGITKQSPTTTQIIGMALAIVAIALVSYEVKPAPP